jgi:hypothetical protein
MSFMIGICVEPFIFPLTYKGDIRTRIPSPSRRFFIEEDFAQEGEQGRFRDCGCNRTRIQAVET